MTVLDALFAVAALAAAAGVVPHLKAGEPMRCVTAGALIVSNGFTYALCLFDVPFNAPFWLTVDLISGGIIWACHQRRTDWLVLALYLPIIPLYFNWSATAAHITVGIVSVQMFLTFPVGAARAFWREAARFNRDWNPWDGFDLRGYAGAST